MIFKWKLFAEAIKNRGIDDLHIQVMIEINFHKYLRIPQGTHSQVGDFKDVLLSVFLRHLKLVLDLYLPTKTNLENIQWLMRLLYPKVSAPKRELKDQVNALHTTVCKGNCKMTPLNLMDRS